MTRGNTMGGNRPTVESQHLMTPPSTSYSLDKRVNSRTAIIFGGFPGDTCRAEMEEASRSYMHGVEGVLRVGALGKYGNTGRVCFNDNNTMWIFIKANAGGKKFDFLDAKDSIWFCIEKRMRSASRQRKWHSWSRPW